MKLTKHTKQDRSKPQNTSRDHLYTNNKVNLKADYFVASLNTKTDRATSAETATKIHNEFNNMFTGIGCFMGTFSLKSNDDTKPYQVPPRYVTNVLQGPFKKSQKDFKNSRY